MAKKPTITKDNDATPLIKDKKSLDGVVIPNRIPEPPATLSISLKRDVHTKFYEVSNMEPELTKGEFLNRLLDFYLSNK